MYDECFFYLCLWRIDGFAAALQHQQIKREYRNAGAVPATVIHIVLLTILATVRLGRMGRRRQGEKPGDLPHPTNSKLSGERLTM